MDSNWKPSRELPDLRKVGVIALDTETKDEGIRAERGSAWPWSDGYVCGVSVAYRAGDAVRSHYFPLRHPDSQNFDRDPFLRWLKDLVQSNVRVVTQNGLYDWGWLLADAGIMMPPAERLEEIGALATLVDENRRSYSLDALCEWRELPGKDAALLLDGCAALGLIPNGRKKFRPQGHIWQLPAHYVGPYAEADAANTLALYESLRPVLDQEGTHDAYRLEVDLLPMVLEMRRRGIRIDIAAAERARDQILKKRDTALAELSDKLGKPVGMDEINSPIWKTQTFDAQKITYPRTEKGNGSFRGGKLGWMGKHPHWLPQLIATADKYDHAGEMFLNGHILGHVIKGRIHGEINPHRSEDGGTKSFRFSYTNPPLQQMPSRDKELGPLIRSVFLPEEGQVWAKPDVSQQEFRLLVHYALICKLPGAQAAAEKYQNDVNADIHQIAADMTSLPRGDAKNVNFAKIYGAGKMKFAEMISKPANEAAAIYAQYDERFPFVSKLSARCKNDAERCGYTKLYDGARRHWNLWEAANVFAKGAGPCSREEALQRYGDSSHPWHQQQLRRHKTYTALNALIQGSAARHTKLWMRACYREGIVPLLQMHDALDCSVSSREQGELVARLGCEAIKLEVPMRVDLKFGRNWGDATHTWEQLAGNAAPDAAEPIQARQPDANSTPGPEILQQNSQPPPWEEAKKEAPMFESQQEKPRGNGRGFNGYPHGEDEPAGAQETITFTYYRVDRTPHLRVTKLEVFEDGKREKRFPQAFWVDGRWIKKKPSEWTNIPYRLPELLAAPGDAIIDIMEGEKDADRGAELGLITTCNPEGAGNWHPELNEHFHGRRVRIHEDNDDAGRKHVLKVSAALKGTAKEILIVRYPEVPPTEDFSWFMDHGGTIKAMLARAKPVEARPAFPFINMSTWDDEPVPEREWAIPDRVPLGQVGLFSGEGGTGKSLLEMAKDVAHTASQEWLGSQPAQGGAFYIGAEDDEKEIHRRLAAIANYYGVTFKELIASGFKARCLLGQDAVLCAVAGKSGRVEVTNLYRQLYEAAGDHKPINISIDTLSRAFAGSEIDRVQVYAFAQHMQALAMASGGSVTVLSHPSLAGIASGSGLSGSTAWHGAFRFRQYLKGTKPEAGELPDNNLRELEFKKNQYGPLGETVVLEYRNGLFLPVAGVASLDKAAQHALADETFLELLRRFTTENRIVHARRGPGYAPKAFAGEDEAKRHGFTSKVLEAAMGRLFKAGKIWNEPYGRSDRPNYRLAVKTQ